MLVLEKIIQDPLQFMSFMRSINFISGAQIHLDSQSSHRDYSTEKSTQYSYTGLIICAPTCRKPEERRDNQAANAFLLTKAIDQHTEGERGHMMAKLMRQFQIRPRQALGEQFRHPS